LPVNGKSTSSDLAASVWRLQRPHHHERHRFEPAAHLVGRVATPLTDAGMQDLTPFVSKDIKTALQLARQL
jgi:hypothetical protein